MSPLKNKHLFLRESEKKTKENRNNYHEIECPEINHIRSIR